MVKVRICSSVPAHPQLLRQTLNGAVLWTTLSSHLDCVYCVADCELADSNTHVLFMRLWVLMCMPSLVVAHSSCNFRCLRARSVSTRNFWLCRLRLTSTCAVFAAAAGHWFRQHGCAD
jgi:hypothetical protein